MTGRLFSSYRRATALLALLGAASLASTGLPGQSTQPLTQTVNVGISGDNVAATLSLPGGIDADVSINFDSTQNLSAANLGLTAQLVDVNAPGLLARLPDSLLTSVPSAFPVLITVEPPASGGLAFTNSYTFNIHTHNLLYVPGTPLRIFKAPLGGNFIDITEAVSQGSINTRGREGGFSQFLIVADLRPNASVAMGKFNALSTRLANAAMPAALRTQLSDTLAAARAAFDVNDYATAIGQCDNFRAQVRANAGSGLANVWRAQRDLDNVEGSLDGMAATLRFTLSNLQTYGP